MRVLHTMLRVRDLDASVDFYTKRLGMQILRRIEEGDGKRVIFLGYADERDQAGLELVYAPDKLHLIDPDFFGHIAIEVEDALQSFLALSSNGAVALKEPKTKGDELIASVADPDGYKIELIEFLGRARLPK